jgi:hypothetical protein
VLAIPSKRHDKRQVHFLTRPEIEDRGDSRHVRSNDMDRPPRSYLAVARGTDGLAPLRAHLT